MDTFKPQRPSGALSVKVPMKLPVKIPMIPSLHSPPTRLTHQQCLNKPQPACPDGNNTKQARVEVLNSALSPSMSSHTSCDSSSPDSGSSNDSRNSTVTKSDSSERDWSNSPSSSTVSSSETLDEPTLFQMAENEGLLNDEALFQDDDEPMEPIIPPRPPIFRIFPSNLDKAIERHKDKLNREENAIAIKDENKTVSLGTSKVNYIDPRIICSWAREQNVPINKIFSATLQKKFPWALDAEGFEF